MFSYHRHFLRKMGIEVAFLAYAPTNTSLLYRFLSFLDSKNLIILLTPTQTLNSTNNPSAAKFLLNQKRLATTLQQALLIAIYFLLLPDVSMLGEVLTLLSEG